MKSLCRYIISVILSLTLCMSVPASAVTVSDILPENCPVYEQADMSSKAYIVIEAQTGRVLCGQNIHQRLPMASTTKIMGALMVLEQPNLDEYFQVDPEAIQVEGSSMGLIPGDMASLYSLACGMLLPSGNDAANAAAVRISGSVEKFVEEMNKKAREIGLEDTNYVTACGLDAPEHYSSAFDLAKLSRVAMQNPDFAQICKRPTIKVSFGNPPYDRWLKNYNKLLKLYPDCIGIKTGLTDNAGRCLVSAAERDGMTLICVTLNAQDDWNLHSRLYDHCFEKYSMQPLPEVPASVTMINPDDEGETQLPLMPAYEQMMPLKDGESSNLSCTVIAEPFVYEDLPNPSLPKVWAYALYSLGDRPLCSVPLVSR